MQEFDIENSIQLQSGTNSGNSAQGAANLKRMPALSTTHKGTAFSASGWTSLEDTFLDLSFNDTLTLVRVYGTNVHPVRGLKGLVVSSAAPFNGASPQINISYTGLAREALVALFQSLPTVTDNQVCNITGATGAADLTADDLAVATSKGWTITR